MESIFDHKFRFYTSKMNEICLHCHWLYFSSIIMSFGQGDMFSTQKEKEGEGAKNLGYGSADTTHCTVMRFSDLKETSTDITADSIFEKFR